MQVQGALNICNVNLTAREREIVDLLRADPLLDAAAVAERIGSTRAAVSVHLSNLTRKGVVLGRGYLLRPEAGSVLVVGGAVLDTKVRTAVAPVLGTSNPGTASATVGGVGRNIAENLARLGRPTVLVAAVGDDPAGDTVVQRTSAAGVECRHVVRLAAPHRHLRRRARRAAATCTSRWPTCAPPTSSPSPTSPSCRPCSAEPTPWSSTPTSTRPSSGGCSRPPRTPACRSVFEPVSVAKATAAAPVLDGSVRVHTVTPNVDELAALVGHPVDDTVDAVRAAADDLHARGVEHVWVRRGTRGSLLSVGRRRATPTARARAPCSSAPPRSRSPTSPAPATR